MENITPQYAAWLADWKKRIQSAQIKAALSVNRELLVLFPEPIYFTFKNGICFTGNVRKLFHKLRDN